MFRKGDYINGGAPKSTIVQTVSPSMLSGTNGAPTNECKQRFTPALRAFVAAAVLAILALSFDWPTSISSVLVLSAVIALLTHFFPVRITEHLQWIKDNLKLATVGALVSISGFLVLNYTSSLKQEIDLLRAAVEAEKVQSAETLRNRDEKIQNLLEATSNVPVLLSPANSRSRASVSHIVLHWASRVPQAHYLVEMTHFDSKGLTLTKVLPATNPTQASSTYPTDLNQKLSPGIYFWRVAAGDLEAGHIAPQSSWSGFYRFDVFTSTIDRISHNQYLTIGVTYNQNSDFMRRNEDGSAYGFDAELMKLLSDVVGKQVAANNSNWGKPEVIEYESIDDLLRTGVKGGEVDFALSSVTKTKYREDMGIRFTAGYFDSHLIVLSRPGIALKGIKNIQLGFIEKTTNEYAAQELCHLYQCTPVSFKSFQDLVNALEDGAVLTILVDEPLSRQMLLENRVKVVLHDVGTRLPAFREQIGYPKEQYAIATMDTELQKTLTKVLVRLQDDGTLSQLRKKYNLGEEQ